MRRESVVVLLVLALLLSLEGSGASSRSLWPQSPRPPRRQCLHTISNSFASPAGTADNYISNTISSIPRGGGRRGLPWIKRIIPPGWNPFGYKITGLGSDFLLLGGGMDCDVGRFLSSLKNRKRYGRLKSEWLEIVRVTKSSQTMRIYRSLEELLEFCMEAGFVR